MHKEYNNISMRICPSILLASWEREQQLRSGSFEKGGEKQKSITLYFILFTFGCLVCAFSYEQSSTAQRETNFIRIYIMYDAPST